MSEPKFKVGDMVMTPEDGMGKVEAAYEIDGIYNYRIRVKGATILTLGEGYKKANNFVDVCNKLDEEKEPEAKFEGLMKQANDQANDPVNHPSHYCQGGIECIEALKAATTDLVGIEAVCTANAIKYLWRHKHKNGVEDLKKAIFYIERLIQHYEKQEQSNG